jgi:hypothetical protein
LGFYPVAVVLTLVHTIQMFSPGGSSPYTSTHNTNGHMNIHKNNNTKQTIHNYKTNYIQYEIERDVTGLLVLLKLIVHCIAL